MARDTPLMVKRRPKQSVRAGRVRSGDRPGSDSLTVAHDVRNLLAVIVTNVDFAMGEPGLGQDHSERRAALCDARDAAGRICSLLAHVLRRDRSAPVPFAVRPGAIPAMPRVAKILVIDDEAEIGAALRRSLPDCEVLAMTDGKEALHRLLGGETFDVILCDLMMPGLTGADVYAELGRAAPDQAKRMVFVTAGAGTVSAHEFISSVPNVVIRKPFEMRQIRDVILAGLRQASVPQRAERQLET